MAWCRAIVGAAELAAVLAARRSAIPGKTQRDAGGSWWRCPGQKSPGPMGVGGKTGLANRLTSHPTFAPTSGAGHFTTCKSDGARKALALKYQG